ncbi:heavy-metal-associated domain-containing protein [Flavobacterium sp. UMI-01]|uniref:heavy-metal-associated domain-containing protein n=1 Tax=Flavobacterium sp. UMI-01 TaxID=1441053 RepID=UPI001C7CAB38|nr:heavy-metal-associated domain-containing protein [Flavobacterium sp. UMI-01]GIZ10352.1 hypothetical protein FUMI01_30760 [Flavobacterium sp. UMI-01]
MKNLVMLLLMTICNTAFAQINKAEIVATGLTCSMCSNAIYKQLLRNPEIENVETNLNTNTFTVYPKKGNQLTPNDLKENVEKSGFFIGSLIVYLPANTLKIKDMKTMVQGNSLYVFLDEVAQINDTQLKVKLYDKGFVTSKEYKKNLKSDVSSWKIGEPAMDVYHIKTIR